MYLPPLSKRNMAFAFSTFLIPPGRSQSLPSSTSSFVFASPHHSRVRTSRCICRAPPTCTLDNPTNWRDSSDQFSTPPLSSPTSESLEPEQTQPDNRSPLHRISTSLWQFSRPHTIYGTFLSVFSMTVIAYLTTQPTSPFVFVQPLLTSLIPALLLNIYIVGLNQLYDIPIDKINKPYLPLASGAMTLGDGRFVILTSLALGLSFCLLSFPLATAPLRIVLTGSAILGTIYSAPPFRLKRFALLASIAILTVRGLLVNLCFFLHAVVSSSSSSSATITNTISKWSLAGVAVPPVILFATAFFTVFGIVIALLKDVPDIQGDVLFGIRTFSVRMGAPAVFRTCVALLVSMFVAAGIFYFSVATKGIFGRCVSLVLHLGMALFLFLRSKKVDTSKPSSITEFYMLSWKAFYAEYLFLPFAAL